MMRILVTLGFLSVLAAGCTTGDDARTTGNGGTGGGGAEAGTGGSGGSGANGGDGGAGGDGGGSAGTGGAPSPCGNGEIDDDEACDDGPGNSDLRPDACRTDCTKAHCGDGVVDSRETCDPGDDRDSRTCSAFCQYVGPEGIPGMRCSPAGARSRDLVCVDSGSGGLYWMVPCERTIDCGRQDVCIEVHAGGPVTVCFPNWCAGEARLGPGANGAVWERCDTQYGAGSESWLDGLCLPAVDLSGGPPAGVCVKGGRIPRGEACRWVDDRFAAWLCEPGTECLWEEPFTSTECESDEDCAGEDAPSYCDDLHWPQVCRPWGACADLCNVGTGSREGEAACVDPGASCVDPFGWDLPPQADQIGYCELPQ